MRGMKRLRPRSKGRLAIYAAAVVVVVTAAITIPLSLGGGTSSAGPLPERGSSEGGTAQARTLAVPLAQFGFDLLARQAKASDGNIVISPVSVHAVLSMIANGARDETAAELASVLHTGALTPAEVNQGWADLITAAQSGEKTAVTICNALWLNRDFSFNPDFLELDKQYFAADCLPLKRDPDAALAEINAWVAQRTQGKIKKILGELMPEPFTVMVVVNTVNLKVGWDIFDAADTKREPFTLADEQQVEVEMMHGSAFTEAVVQDAFQAVRLRTDGPVDVWLAVPKGAHTPEDVAAELRRGGGVRALWQHASTADATIALPRFVFSYAAGELEGDLQAMGIRRLFDREQAQLEGIVVTGPQRLFITQIVHKARIEVNEQGVEAQAATAAESDGGGMPQVVNIRADRPFLMILSESGSGAPLFLALVRDPR